MTALYPSTSAAQVFIGAPLQFIAAIAGNPIEPAYLDGPLADIQVTLIRPSGADVVFALDALPSGVTGTVNSNLTFATSIYTTSGIYTVIVEYNAANVTKYIASFQWGGWVDTVLASTANAEGAAEICQSVLTGSYDVDDPAAPTVQTLSVSGTPYATRTIANADGSAVNPAQVLILGELTPVP